METNTLLQVGVKALLRNKDGKYLLLKRNMEKYKAARGSWDLVGGRINPGTPLFENLKREVQEETQLAITSEPKLIFAQDILHIAGKHVVRLTYIADVEGEIVLDTSENLEYKWLTLDEIKKQEDLDMYLKELIDKDLL
ncbi:MAG: GDP-mannose mannosyl hydrolase [Candidatus Paceibacter sp.]|jgi:ADP-ribose pyrophosphatase YjhB (NUDIX family)|nr:GDP-mannose mannosyl hydrolase [Candidatus Paceibacter sp.]